MVRMWPYSFSLMWLTIAASVVDLPEPVGPVTSTMPRGWSAISAKIFGAFSSSSDRTLRRNRPHHRGRAAVLHERVDAEAREARDREREVALEVLLVVLALPVVHDVVDHRRARPCAPSPAG